MNGIPPKMSPMALYKCVQNGVFPNYKHRVNQDAKLRELNVLKRRYIKSRSLEDKKDMLLKEREMLYEEYTHPELTLARNYSELVPLLQREKESVSRIIKNINISSLARQEGILMSFSDIIDLDRYKKAVSSKKIVALLTDGWKTAKDTKHSNFIEDCIFNIYRYVDLMNPFSKPVEKKLGDLFVTSGDENVMKSRFARLWDEFFYAHRKNEVTTKHVTKLLKDKKATKEKRQLAIWAAGKFRSKENFEILKKIAADSKETSPIARQNAIHSLAFYVRTNNKEVREILAKIEQEKSVFSPLARIITDKLDGKYHGIANREQKYNFFNAKSPETLRAKMDGIFDIDFEVNGQTLNRIDVGLIPFANIFKGKKLVLTEDTVTKYRENGIGKREMSAFYPNCGPYLDSIDGVSDEFGTIVGKTSLINRDGCSVIAHELGHMLNSLFENTSEQRALEKLYKKALIENRCLDSYAQLDVTEYFAQGCEAYASIYKSHRSLYDSFEFHDSYTNTRYKLLEKDPDLYNFVEKMLKKYSKKNSK